MGREKMADHHRDVPHRVPEKDVLDNHESDQGNVVIHGDNLEALEALLPEYGGSTASTSIRSTTPATRDGFTTTTSTTLKSRRGSVRSQARRVRFFPPRQVAVHDGVRAQGAGR